jgi:metal transporter CNNM
MDIGINILLVVILVGISAMYSGLNVALMALNVSELKRQASLGNKKARRVYPIRKNTHLALTSILIGNVGAAAATALFLGESAGNGFVAGAISTLLLVVFGELLPQALFIRNALTICSFLSPILKLTIFVTYPIAKPLQLLLDAMLGDHSDQHLHTRHELGLIISEHLGEDESELDEDEVEIIRGALQLSEKQVTDIMTPIESVYWLDLEDVIDGEKIDEIKAAHWSRIPVFDRKRTKCYGVVHVKNLVDIDFDENPIPVKSMKLYQTKQVGSRTALDTMFRHFIGARSHLIPVEKKKRIVGIVTIEDLIEEIIGHEIIDESDHAMNRV